MARRLVYRVKPARKGWRLVLPNGTSAAFDRKSAAIANGRSHARADWEVFGRPAQLVVHGRDGRIQYEHTYGHDPRRTRG